MSASIMWRPLNQGKHLSVGAPSSFIESLERAFGSFPLKPYGEDAARVLDGMAAATEYKEFREAYQQLAAAVREEGEIEIFAVY